MEVSRSKSVDSSPSMNFKHGIPLGSLTAKLASKSFWSTEMLQKTLEEVTKCAAQEVNSSLCSSSTKSLNESDGQFSDVDINRISELSDAEADVEADGADHENMEIEEAVQQRELRNPLSAFHSNCRGYRTPPYLSPGITRKLVLSNRTVT